MKKGTKQLMLRVSGFIVILFTFLSATVVADVFYTFKEGLEYERVNVSVVEKSTDGMTVIKLFRYGCGHCYKMEPVTEQWLKSKPEDVDFESVPFTGSDEAILHARTFYTMEALGLYDSLHLAFYKQRAKATEEDVLKFVTSEEFYRAINSPEVRKKYERADKLSKELGDDTYMTAFIVNNKFLIQDNRLFSGKVYFKIIDQLLAEERSLLNQQ